ncbi:MAG: HlyD family efflux transporter periplasmic adaptor subunit [Planctomycetota bacterium]|nr:HlyD family efflux transporter periplasmic adaptor subunit [Planctomycetota bacterium]
MRGICLWTLVVPLLALGACGGDVPPPETPARPVVTMPLEVLAPNPPLVLTGVAEPYREAEVSFEVSGRITFILDVGRTVQVNTTTRKGQEGNMAPEALGHRREVIAQIDDTAYRQRRDAAKLKLETALQGLKAQQLDLDEVAPAAVRRAEAQSEAAESEITSARASVASAESTKNTAGADLERNRKLLRDRQIPKAEFDQFQNAYDTAVANLQKAKASVQAAEQQLQALEATLTEAEAALRLKKVEVDQTNAQIAELRNALKQAQTDLDHCKLEAPFGGRITKIHASQGDFVAAGTPVLSLTLIDPIKVSVTVSADRERQIQPGSYATVTPAPTKNPEPDADDEKEEDEAVQLFGTVFEKGAVADPATRTFRIDVMVRNARRNRAKTGENGLTRIGFRQILPAVERHHDEGGPLYVCRECVATEKDTGKQVLYRLKGGKFARPRPAEMFEGRLDLERVEVNPIDGGPENFMQILNWSFQRMDPVEGYSIDYGDLFVRFEPPDVTLASIERGAVFDRYDWAIRPGDLVPVVFEGKASPRGIWVPDDAIRVENEKRSVFVVENGKARAVPVSVHESVGRLRRIEGEALKAGLRVVVVGMHYVHDGADVAVSKEASLSTLMGQGR